MTVSKGVFHDPAWPLIACRGPRPEVWENSGYGLIFVARRRPDGSEVWTLATLSLSQGGVMLLVGKSGPSGTAEDMLKELGNLTRFTASVTLPAEVVAEYAYGAVAFSYEELPEWRWPREVRGALSLLPRPVGQAAAWRERLIGQGGLTPEDLVRIIEKHHHRPDEPDGKDPVVITTTQIALGTGQGREVMRRLLARQDPPLFVDVGQRGGAAVLEWVRPYESGIHVPTGHKMTVAYRDHASPDLLTYRILSDAGHQVMGQIIIDGDTAEVESLTLSRASVLMGVLAEVAGAPLAITSTHWETPISDPV